MVLKKSEAMGQISDPEIWVNLYGDYLYKYAFSRVQDAATAEDLVQETFLAALNGHHQFQGRSSERTWLTAILRHKIVDHLRKKNKEHLTDDIEALSGPASEFFDERGDWRLKPAKWTVDPAKLVERKEFWKVLSQCLSKLSGRLAQVFVLRELDGLSTEEICGILNISATNSWVMLYRARMNIRRCLEINWFEADALDES